MIKIILSLISAGLLIYLGVTLPTRYNDNSPNIISMLAAVPVLYAGKITKFVQIIIVWKVGGYGKYLEMGLGVVRTRFFLNVFFFSLI